MIDEKQIQSIARFLVGFGTEQDDKWRDYNLDLAGTITYDSEGNPKAFDPSGNSGYSLGSLQWDFGQNPALSVPFVEAFEGWIAQNPNARPLTNDPEFVGRALSLTGHKLAANPRLGLSENDVRALSEFVRSDDGCDWVNVNIDQNLIGSDQQPNILVNGKKLGQTLVNIARQTEKTKAFKAFLASNRPDMADLICAIGMKTYNQSPGTFSGKLLSFLGSNRTPDEVSSWSKQFGGGLGSGVGAATTLSLFWAAWLKANTEAMADDLVQEMTDECLANPIKTSRASGIYILAKQVFEDTDRFAKFTKAMNDGKDFIDARLFVRSTGAIAIHPTTKRLKPGLLAFKGSQYVWNGAGDAFKNAAGGWQAILVKKINIKTL